MSDNKSPQVSKTLLGILADLNKGCSLDGLDPSSYFQVLQSFGDRTDLNNTASLKPCSQIV